MSTENDLDHYQQTMMPSWGRPLAAFERGAGSYVWDVDGSSTSTSSAASPSTCSATRTRCSWMR